VEDLEKKVTNMYYPKSEEEARALLRPSNPSHPIRCADGRVQAEGLSEGVELETDGAHVIGGTSYPYYVTARIATEVGEEVDPELLWDYSMQAVERAGFVNGVHVDNHHPEESGEFDTGCGWEAHLGNDPETFGVGAYAKPVKDLTALARRTGVPVMVLGGNHNEGFAIVNHRVGETFNNEAHVENQQGFCHDAWAAEAILREMAEVLREKGHIALADKMVAKSPDSEKMLYADKVGMDLLGQVLNKLAPHIVEDQANRIIHVN
jgi:hypothetical protein